MTLFKLVRLVPTLMLSALVSASPVFASEQGTAAEAEAMVKKAVAYIKTNGPDKAYEEITHGKTFKDRDLFISVFDLNGRNLAQGVNPKLVGKNLIDLKDPDGKPTVKMFVDLAKDKGKGWTDDYKYLNPVSQKMERKSMYLERFGDTLVGCGIYKP